MQPLTESTLRSTFVNASKRERAQTILPPGFDELDWPSLEYLGWGNPKLPLVGYVVGELDGTAVGIRLTKADGSTRTRPQCSWCEDVSLPNPVLFYVARRAGAAGRKGDTVGTLVCQGFQCPANVRRTRPTPYHGFDDAAAEAERIARLRENVAAFLRSVIA